MQNLSVDDLKDINNIKQAKSGKHRSKYILELNKRDQTFNLKPLIAPKPVELHVPVELPVVVEQFNDIQVKSDGGLHSINNEIGIKLKEPNILSLDVDGLSSDNITTELDNITTELDNRVLKTGDT